LNPLLLALDLSASLKITVTSPKNIAKKGKPAPAIAAAIAPMIIINFSLLVEYLRRVKNEAGCFKTGLLILADELSKPSYKDLEDCCSISNILKNIY
jgi:hypothetical protein